VTLTKGHVVQSKLFRTELCNKTFQISVAQQPLPGLSARDGNTA